MQPEARDAAHLWDMLDAAREVLDFVNGMDLEQFSADRRTRLAVERQLLVVGEAAAHLSERFTGSHPEIPWRSIVGLRNVIAHEYGEILVDRLWRVVCDHLPALVAWLQDHQVEAPGDPPGV